MGSERQRVRRGWLCCSAPAAKHDGSEPAPLRVQGKAAAAAAQQQDGTANLFVQAGSAGNSPAVSSAGSPSPSPSTPGRVSPLLMRSASTESCVWHDAQEEWAAADATSSSSSTAEQPQATAAADAWEQALAGLPAELANIVAKYKSGRAMGCKPTVALLRYMEASGTDLAALRALLAPALAAEDASLDMPAPTPAMPPVERTRSLRAASMMRRDGAGAGAAGAGGADSSGSGGTPSVERLLTNVALVEDTMAGIDADPSFKQVAWGPLELWYKHDTTAGVQGMRARTVLEEPVANVMCLAREVDLVTSWNPAIADMRELGAFSASELLVSMLLWTPWPLPAPEVVNYALGVDLLDSAHGCVLLATRAAPAQLPPGCTPPPQPRAMRLTMEAGGFRFVPLPPHPDRPGVPRTLVDVLVVSDATRWAVPDAVISFILKVFAPLVHRTVVKVLRRLFHAAEASAEGDGALLARLASRPVYGAVAGHVEAFLAKQAAAGEQQQAAAAAGGASG